MLQKLPFLLTILFFYEIFAADKVVLNPNNNCQIDDPVEKKFHIKPSEESFVKVLSPMTEALFQELNQNHDNFLSKFEIGHYLAKKDKNQFFKTVERVWNELHPIGPKLAWQHYENHIYLNERKNHPMLARDYRRWFVADEDQDTFLNLNEFRTLLFPEWGPIAMKQLVIEETLREADLDHDGKLSLEEYLRYHHNECSPDYVDIKPSGDDFTMHWDANGDGFLDNEELYTWKHQQRHRRLEKELDEYFKTKDQNKDFLLDKNELDLSKPILQHEDL